MRDPDLSFWGYYAPSIGFRGLEAQFWASSKKYQTSAKSIDFVSGHLAASLFACWPDCGECFAPCVFLCIRACVCVCGCARACVRCPGFGHCRWRAIRRDCCQAAAAAAETAWSDGLMDSTVVSEWSGRQMADLLLLNWPVGQFSF